MTEFWPVLEFVNFYGAQESIPPAYVAWQNRFLGSLKVNIFGLSVQNPIVWRLLARE